MDFFCAPSRFLALLALLSASTAGCGDDASGSAGDGDEDNGVGVTGGPSGAGGAGSGTSGAGGEDVPLAPFDLLKDINQAETNLPGVNRSSNPRAFTTLGDRVFFAVNGNTGGVYDENQLWTTDGTRSGTVQVPGILPIASRKGSIAALDHGVVFSGWGEGADREQLWFSDGTAAGTIPLADVVTYDAPRFVRVEGQIFFSADDGIHGSELWVTDGTVDGTRMVRDIHQGQEAGYGSEGIAWEGRYYFFAYDYERETTFWVTDGTEAGTEMLAGGPATNGASRDTLDLAVLGDRVFFSFHDPNFDIELWSTDGTAAGTALFKELDLPSSPSWPEAFHVLGDKMLFFAQTGDATGNQLWVTDGTVAGTVPLADVSGDKDGGFGDTVMNTVGDIAVFNGRYKREEPNHSLWATDGTPEGTGVIADVATLSGRHVAALGTNLVFLGGVESTEADSGTLDYEPWITDGTSEGTMLIKELCPGSCGSGYAAGSGQQQELVVLAGKVYFEAAISPTDMQLFETDGTSAGTRVLVAANATVTENPVGYIPLSSEAHANLGLFAFGDTLLLPADYQGIGAELYRLAP